MEPDAVLELKVDAIRTFLAQADDEDPCETALMGALDNAQGRVYQGLQKKYTLVIEVTE